MPTAELLVSVGLATPVLALLACFSPALRERLWMLLVLIPLPALAAAVVAIGLISSGDTAAVTLLFDPSGLAIGLVVDHPGAVLLGVAALLWAAAGLYAAPMLQASPHRGRFSLFWLLTLTGSLGVFVAADLLSFYLFYGLVSLAAFGLIAHDGTAFARRATSLYLLLAVLGEIALLLAFVLLAEAAPLAGLGISSTVAALDGSPWYWITMALLLIGFALKLALVPVHIWMPLAHTAAPVPASAILSGVAIKAGVIGLIRFLPFEAGAPHWGTLLLVVGLITAYYGVVIGLTQREAKTVLAYSSISQMGLVAAATGLALRAGNAPAVLLLTLYAAHHLLAKGALFLGTGVILEGVSRRRWLVLVPAALLGLGIAGLPLTGGAAAKLALKPLFDTPWLGLLAALSAAGSALLMLHFLRRLWVSGEATAVSIGAVNAHPNGLLRRLLPWWLMALAALVLPWLLLPWLGLGDAQTWLAQSLSPAQLWKSLWPLLLGGVAALAMWRWGERLPQVPPGDILIWSGPLTRLISAVGAGVEALDRGLRQWPVAGLALLILSLLLWGGLLNVH
ncbi:proton-conducting transporter membrane subunit [Lamprobacter modestohalophilus]|uniref:complex I subunit 5 family protein n=1 Tax=Lamprobacter modestohalophilus TaxID=1064514 RepID=UPI002ADEB085|nr:proton-conducting transporter membrane subunit [Lamprobacter modestohalophilus]MEA1051294.1 proton-conducting transporter membrane subunit [Lamprobacter modestohalophilus]